MWLSDGVDCDIENLPRSSADFDQGLRDRLRRSPKPCEGRVRVGEDSWWEVCPPGEPSIPVWVRASERSRTELEISIPLV